MSRLAAILAICFAALLLEACGEKIVASETDKALVEAAIRDIHANDRYALLAKLDPSGQAQIDEFLAVFHRRLPTGSVLNMQLVAGLEGVDAASGKPFARLGYEVSDGEKFALAWAAVSEVSGQRAIVGLSIDVLPASVESIGGFSLMGKSIKHYIFLLLTIVSPITIIVALVTMFHAGPFPRRWLWVLGSVAGVGMFAMNWYSGESQVNPIYLLFLGTGFWKDLGPAAPWTLMFGFPVVAVLFLALRPDKTSHRVSQ